METEKDKAQTKYTAEIVSRFLDRSVTVDFYLPPGHSIPEETSLLLINDGQDMENLGLEPMLEQLYAEDLITPLFCIGIHAGPDRKMEYGTAETPDYKGRGARAGEYARFVFEELLPLVRSRFQQDPFKEKAFAGFSLGALSALDIVWNHPYEFSRVGIFSGSFWWRRKDKNDETYNDDTDRIMHRHIEKGGFYPWLRFFFECGEADEQADRNNNGIIDSIDDTLDLMKELTGKGYDPVRDIYYLQLNDGKHDVATWARSMPFFLRWGWGK